MPVQLLEVVTKPKGVLRLVGLSGIGKSRLVMEALCSADEGAGYLTNIVLYADESEVGGAAISRDVQSWA